MSPEPTELPLICIRSNQFGPQHQHQVHWHQKPTRRHANQGKLQTWWVESSFVLVQHYFSSTVCPEVISEESTENLVKKSFSEIEASDESDCKGSLQLCHLRHQTAWWRGVVKVKVLWVCKLRNTIERGHTLLAVTQVTSQCTTTGDLLKARTQHAAQDGMLTELGLLKSGKLMNWWMIERGNPLFALGQGHTSSNHVSFVNTSTLSLKKKKFTIERGHPLFALNEEQGHSNSSLEMELSFGSRSFLDRVNDQVRKRQKTTFDECYRRRRKTFCEKKRKCSCL